MQLIKTATYLHTLTYEYAHDADEIKIERSLTPNRERIPQTSESDFPDQLI